MSLNRAIFVLRHLHLASTPRTPTMLRAWSALILLAAATLWAVAAEESGDVAIPDGPGKRNKCVPDTCPHGQCLFHACSNPVSCDGGKCTIVNCVKPTCSGGKCVFTHCVSPTCAGGACEFANTLTTLGHGYCEGGRCTIDGIPTPNNMRAHSAL